MRSLLNITVLQIEIEVVLICIGSSIVFLNNRCFDCYGNSAERVVKSVMSVSCCHLVPFTALTSESIMSKAR